MPRRTAMFTGLIERCVEAVRDGATSPDMVWRSVATLDSRVERRTVVMALEAAVQDGTLEWPCSPDGNHIAGGLRLAASA